MDVCEEASCFELVCSRCKYDLNSSINADESTTEQTEYEKELILIICYFSLT